MFKLYISFNLLFFLIIFIIFFIKNFVYLTNKIINYNYEFGSNLIGYNKKVSINFIILGFLFLLFDAELILLLPWLLINYYSNFFIYLIIFFIIETISLMLIFEVYYSVINWYKYSKKKV